MVEDGWDGNLQLARFRFSIVRIHIVLSLLILMLLIITTIIANEFRNDYY